MSGDRTEEDYLDEIYNSYGLTKDLFNIKVLYYEIIKDKTKDFFIKDNDLHKTAALRIEKVEKLLNKKKNDFEDLAKKYSEDVHALKGGDIGYVRLADMDENLRQSIEGLEINDLSGIIKDREKYYIVKVYDIKDGRNGQEIWLKRIAIFKNYTFDEYLDDLIKKAKVWNLIKSK